MKLFKKLTKKKKIIAIVIVILLVIIVRNVMKKNNAEEKKIEVENIDKVLQLLVLLQQIVQKTLCQFFRVVK